MDSKNQKLKKPLSPKTLKQELRGYIGAYEEIAENCILVATGLDENQRREAIESLETCVPEGEHVYVASKTNRRIRRRDLTHECQYWNSGTRELAWTYEGARCWQIVTRIAPNVRTVKVGDRMLYISVN